MKFKQYILEENKGLTIENPQTNVEYTIEYIEEKLKILINSLKEKNNPNFTSKFKNSMIQDLLKKLRLWTKTYKTLFENETDKNIIKEINLILSPKEPKPISAPITPNSPVSPASAVKMGILPGDQEKLEKEKIQSEKK